VEPGSYNSAAIIMLTDGQRTTGPDPLDAAKMAAERGVRVYTVGIGTTKGEIIGFEGWSMRVRLDEETLKNARCQPDPGRVLLRRHRRRPEEGLRVAVGPRSSSSARKPRSARCFAALGALLAVVSAGLSVWWFGRVT
jgi:Ca-activated chloride channel family protein